MRFTFAIIFNLILLSFSVHAATWTRVDYPGGGHTDVTDYQDGKFIGTYIDSSGGIHPFLFDGANWTTLDSQGVPTGTVFTSMKGDTLIGGYIDSAGKGHGILYNGTTWTSVDRPGAVNTALSDMDGTTIFGCTCNTIDIIPPGPSHGFINNGSSWSDFDIPGSTGTTLKGISGNKLFGSYNDSAGNLHGFISQGSNTTKLDMPGSRSTSINGMSGNYVVGTYMLLGSLHSDGFLYDGTTWNTFDMPGSSSTYIRNIDGDTIVGTYTDSAKPYVQHGFICTIPEPATILLLALFPAFLRRR